MAQPIRFRHQAQRVPRTPAAPLAAGAHTPPVDLGAGSMPGRCVRRRQRHFRPSARACSTGRAPKRSFSSPNPLNAGPQRRVESSWTRSIGTCDQAVLCNRRSNG